jgi:hypothetical protein
MKLLTKSILITLFFTFTSLPSNSEEYFGKFLDQLKGAFDTEARPRPVFKIDKDFRFEDPNGLLWSTPSGTSIDGASIPQFFWSLIGGPFDGQYINASVIHDHYCRTKERTAHDTHRNFYYGMMTSNVPEWKADLMHWAVSTFGPSWKIEKRVVLNQECKPSGEDNKTCTLIPTIEMVTVIEPPIDLTDPQVLALAISKTNAIARTLLTSNGKVLDVSSSGQVNATLTSIESNAANYRQLFQDQHILLQTTSLGLLSQTHKTSLAKIQPWDNNTIPHFAQTQFLNINSGVGKSNPFKLNKDSRALILENVDLDAIKAISEIKTNARHYY